MEFTMYFYDLRKLTSGLACVDVSTEEARGGGAGGVWRPSAAPAPAGPGAALRASDLVVGSAAQVSISPTVSSAYSQPAHSVRG